MAAVTPLLGLVTPTQGTLSGTWGDTVNYGISEYVDIAIAGTLSFAGDGAITLTNTTGSSSGTGITTTTAQYMVIRVTGTLTTPKIITAPSYSKLYMVDNAATGSTVSFIRSGQTPAVSVAVGEKCFVYYNGTDYVKIAGSVDTGVTSFTAGSTGFTPSTATTGAVTLAGTLNVANGGTGLTTLTAGYIPFGAGTSAFGNSANLFWDNTNGRLGLGTSSPSARLQIDGTTDATQRVLVGGSGNTSSYKLNYNGTEVAQFQNYQNSEVSIGATANAPLYLVTNNATKVTITTAGNVGIGTTTVASIGSGYTTMQMSGTNGSGLRFYRGATNNSLLYGDVNGLYVQTVENIPLFFWTNGTEKARISAAGGFSVGTTADPGAGAIYATGNITAYYSSDIKFKENVRDIPDALATVNAIGGKLFDWKDDYIESKGGADGYFVQKADFGVVAQDVQKVFPIAVRTREDGSLAVDYEKLGALAFAALVELTKRVEALEAK